MLLGQITSVVRPGLDRFSFCPATADEISVRWTLRPNLAGARAGALAGPRGVQGQRPGLPGSADYGGCVWLSGSPPPERPPGPYHAWGQRSSSQELVQLGDLPGPGVELVAQVLDLPF